MTALRKPALPASVEDEWQQEEDAVLDRYLSGEHDRRRAKTMGRVNALLDAHVPLPKPVVPADEAVRSLLPGLLSDAEMKLVSKGHKQFNRENRK